MVGLSGSDFSGGNANLRKLKSRVSRVRTSWLFLRETATWQLVVPPPLVSTLLALGNLRDLPLKR